MANLHGAEVWATHGTISAAYVVRCLVVLQGPLGVEAEVELVFPAELVTRLAQCIISNHGAGMLLGDVGGVGRELKGYNTLAHILLVG